MQNSAKIFYNNNEEKPITAGGVIFYKIKNNKIYLLLIDSKGIYEDLGGSFDNLNNLNNFNSIYDAISKTVNKVSNYNLDEDSIKQRLLFSKSVYISKLKYLVYIVNANEEESKLKSEIFNKTEDNNISRNIKWIPLDIYLKPKIIKYKLSIQLKHKYILEILQNIEKDMLEWEIFFEKKYIMR